MSNDCKTFLAYQRMQVNRIWIASLDGSESHPITSDEQLFLRPSFSFDDRQIVFSMGSGDPMSRVLHICLMDRDGQGRRKIASGTVVRPICSPDGRWIAYAEFTTGSYTGWISGDSRCCVVDVTNPNNVRIVGRDLPWQWIDNQSFLSFRNSTLSFWQTFIDGREQEKISPDSTIAVPLLESKQVLVVDLRSAREGLYIGPVGSKQQPFPKVLRLVQRFKPSRGDWNVRLSPGNTFVLLVNKRLEFWRISLPSCIEERIQKSFPEYTFGTPVNISNDGKFIVYEGKVETRSKLVLMENPFE